MIPAGAAYEYESSSLAAIAAAMAASFEQMLLLLLSLLLLLIMLVAFCRFTPFLATAASTDVADTDTAADTGGGLLIKSMTSTLPSTTLF